MKKGSGKKNGVKKGSARTFRNCEAAMSSPDAARSWRNYVQREDMDERTYVGRGGRGGVSFVTLLPLGRSPTYVKLPSG